MFLQIEGLTKRYGDTAVVDAMDLGVERGTICCLLGPSGCGKTTTLRMVGGYLAPDAGTVEVDGTDIVGLPPEERPVSTVFQSYALFPHMTVLENVAYGLKCHGMDRTARRAEARSMLASVAMGELADAYPAQLSGGQQQRVSIGRALINDPAIILADEPTGNLDSKSGEEILTLMKLSNQKYHQTIIMITHDLEIASQADRVITFEDGKIIKDERA